MPLYRYTVRYMYRRELHVPAYEEATVCVEAATVADAIAIAHLRAQALDWRVLDVIAVADPHADHRGGMDGLIAGRIVAFVFDERSATDVNRREARGTPVDAGEIYPALIVRVWDQASGCVNVQVFLDGPDTYWATSVMYAGAECARPWPGRTWHWLDGESATRGAAG